ncbi:MAG: STAS domain-containing protein [Gammaproteobacteria bacterium]|nr:STAS domain-containing protein [Gammaproteobacteria bacterium]MDH5513679.1 STAS domain-containing protein [Gammaproteobacteria bacterium]
MADAAVRVGESGWLLSGELDFETVPALLQHRGVQMEAGKNLTIDLAEVTRVDSAGLALMIEWLRESERKNLDMTFTNVPEQLLSIARVCGLDEILFQAR